MKEYLEFDFHFTSLTQEEQELYLALLSDFGFESFREETGRIIAYIPMKEFNRELFDSFLVQSGLKDKVTGLETTTIPEQNWNAIWEKEYSPVRFGDQCIVRAPFHSPSEHIGYDLVISPKMSFGTAHHETTRLMIEFILEGEWTRQKVLDFGCGTGILAILAEKMGAHTIIAIDNDPWAYQNALENIELNDCSSIEVQQGLIENLKEESFDTILGNVNLNVLLSEMHNLGARLKTNGIAMLSGFYEHDLHKLSRKAEECGLFLLENRSVEEWTVAVYRKGD